MAQDSFQVDQLQIEPYSGDTLKISRDSADGSLKLEDANLSITLKETANLGTISGVLLVGKSGSGAAHSTITSALAAVPANSSVSSPTLIMVFPGSYSENLTISKDAVILRGMGGVTLTNSSEAATITVSSAVITTPTYCSIQGMKIVNTAASKSCIFVSGGAGSTVGSVGVEIKDCSLVASGSGGYAMQAVSANSVLVSDVSCHGSSASANLSAVDCSDVQLRRVVSAPPITMNYDSASAAKPSVVGSSYSLSQVEGGSLISTLDGTGSLSISQSSLGDMNLNGDKTCVVLNSSVGDLTVNNTMAVTLKSSSRGTATGAGTLAEEVQYGSSAISSSSTLDVSLEVEHPDDAYTVSLDAGLSSIPWTTNKSATGFRVNFSGPVTSTVSYQVMRKV